MDMSSFTFGIILWTLICVNGTLGVEIQEEPVSYETEYISLIMVGDQITSLRFDGEGTGRYGLETICDGGALRYVTGVEMVRNHLVIYAVDNKVEWDLPFLCDGHYDSDAHVNYLDPRTNQGANELTLPFRAFIGSSGHVTRIEHFKNMSKGDVILWLNTEEGNRLLMQSDRSQNWDLDVKWPGCERVNYEVRTDRLTLKAGYLSQAGNGPMTAPIRIEVTRAGTREVPLNTFLMPGCEFEPDFNVTYDPTGKNIPASLLMTELLQQGIYWSPIVNLRGEWVVGAVETHLFDDAHNYYSRHLREDLLKYLGFIGYDRFEHFGHIYQWGRYPDYGAGFWFNKPPNNAPIDMRMLHINGMWVHALMQYVLATQDKEFLMARRARWLSTDGDEYQPLCGEKAEAADYVLSSGDVRLDGRMPSKVHSLGQSFTAKTPFSCVRARLGNPAGAIGVNDLQGGYTVIEEDNHGRMALYRSYGGELLAVRDFSIPPRQTMDICLEVGFTLSPGQYYLEVTDDDSGHRYFGPGITWMTQLESDYQGGDAYSGPFHGNVSDMITLLFDFMVESMGAKEANMTYYQDDPEYNIPDQKSGRDRLGQANSFWEGAGNAWDSYQGLWYPAACTAMAEMAELFDDSRSAQQYRQLRIKADQTYNQFFWHTALDNGRKVPRYFHCRDWDGVRRDFGYAYNNLEAATRGIASPAQCLDILRWLDCGQYSPDGGKTWKDDIYSIWEIAPPYNTIGNQTYLPACQTLPYLQVISNGGSRPEIAARDLAVRAKYLSIDNMHERNGQILKRYASPDRLTGGRMNNDHWIGRWQFLGPEADILDFEGFREIFPQSGSLPALQPTFYFDFDFTAKGLWLCPRVPSNLESVRFNHFSYAGTMMDFNSTALRENVDAEVIGTASSSEIVFKASKPFNKTGVRICLEQDGADLEAKVALTLEVKKGHEWIPVAENWYNHARHGDCVWVDAQQWLSTRKDYRLRISTMRSDVPVTVDGAQPLRLVAEKTQLDVVPRDKRQAARFAFVKEKDYPLNTHLNLSVILNPGERIMLCPQPPSVSRQD